MEKELEHLLYERLRLLSLEEAQRLLTHVYKHLVEVLGS